MKTPGGGTEEKKKGSWRLTPSKKDQRPLMFPEWASWTGRLWSEEWERKRKQITVHAAGEIYSCAQVTRGVSFIKIKVLFSGLLLLKI